jgi:hypothetical protein
MNGHSLEWSPTAVTESRRNIRRRISPRLGRMEVSKVRAMHLDGFHADSANAAASTVARWPRHRCGRST